MKWNIAIGTIWHGIKNRYRNYVVPISSCYAISWKANESGSRTIENIQEKLQSGFLDLKVWIIEKLKRLYFYRYPYTMKCMFF